MPLTDNRGWAIGRVEVRIPEIAEASSYRDFRPNISVCSSKANWRSSTVVGRRPRRASLRP